MRQLERLQARLIECRLPAEDDASLRRQSAEYLARHPQDAFRQSKNTKNTIVMSRLMICRSTPALLMWGR